MNAPLVVFGYNRPEHLEMTLSALAKNVEAKDSYLYIFIDGPKEESAKETNQLVEEVAYKTTKDKFAFVEVRNSSSNKGLAKSVISGVTEIINKYGKVIVTEDDAVPSSHYLRFMNSALDYYEANEKVWSVGGYTVPLKCLDGYDKDFFITQRSSSYAWGIWKNRWEKIDWEMHDFPQFHWNFCARKGFNLWGNDRSSMMDDQMLGRVNSWAIRFDYAMFANNAYNILPKQSLIQNIGHDGSGTHSTSDSGENDPFKVNVDESTVKFEFDNRITVNEEIRKEFIGFFDSSTLNLVKRFAGNQLRFWKLR